jgi:hypothetical protein
VRNSGGVIESGEAAGGGCYRHFRGAADELR